MHLTKAQLEHMFRDDTTEQLEARETRHQQIIDELKAIGHSWALDCRKMRIATANGCIINAELQRRKHG